MALLSKYAAVLAMFISSISAIPLDVVNDAFEPQEGTFQSFSEVESNVPYILSSDVGNLTAHVGLEKRQACGGGQPNANAICGPDFVDMGNKGWGPALAAMPQWNHARLNSVEQSCYPEDAKNAAGNGQNPGLPRGDSALPVGSSCRDPTSGAGYSGPLQRSAPFPVYVDGVYCPGDTTWRIIYSTYYPKDFTHRHDWERTIVVFGKTTGDWWDRQRIILAQHSGFNKLPWSSATAHDDPYSSSPNRGSNGAHPRVFVGMYKHATFNEAKTSCLGPGCQSNDQEYRRNNWQFSPVLSDIRNGVAEIPNTWEYEGKTPPWKFVPQVCGL